MVLFKQQERINTCVIPCLRRMIYGTWASGGQKVSYTFFLQCSRHSNIASSLPCQSEEFPRESEISIRQWKILTITNFVACHIWSFCCGVKKHISQFNHIKCQRTASTSHQKLHFFQHNSSQNIIHIDTKIGLEVDCAKIEKQKIFANPNTVKKFHCF